jgi:hypothetical protein
MFNVKKILIAFILMFATLGLTGCDLFNSNNIPNVCGDGYELQGTECVPIEVSGDIPVITLIGDPEITIAVGDAFADLGATASDTEDGDLTSSIVVNSTVNLNVAGVYTITYDVVDSDDNAAETVTRTVTVVEPGNNAPVVTLIGDSEVTVETGDVFTDPGATASDVEDGDLTTSIIVTGFVDTSVAGVYVITYMVTDSDQNNSNVAMRTVTVQPSDAEVLARYMADNWDGTMSFLGLTKANMDFSSAMNMDFDLNFEVTEDIDETHHVNAHVVDQYIYDTYDTISRNINVDFDGDYLIDLNVIYQEVDGGVLLYIEYRPILDIIASQNNQIIDMLNWVGLDNQWAKFEINDSLENVIEVEVVKDMLVSLFFSKVGETYFDDLQENLIEETIGFDLNQYGVDLGAFIDLLISENFADAQAMLENIQAENIALHADHMYIAWRLYEYFSQFDTDLTGAGFDVSKLELLNTATWNDTTNMMEVNLPIDPLKGTQAFFESLTQDEINILVEDVIKPELESALLNTLFSNVSMSGVQTQFEQFLTNYQDFITENWPSESDPFVYADQFALLQSQGVLNYWRSLTPDEQNVFYNAIDNPENRWDISILDDFIFNNEAYKEMLHVDPVYYNLSDIETQIYSMIQENLTTLNDVYGLDGTSWLSDIDYSDVAQWVTMISEYDEAALWDIATNSGNQLYVNALNDLMYIKSYYWEYGYVYTNGIYNVSVGEVTNVIINVLYDNQYTFENDYGFDVDALVTEIYSYKDMGVEWFLYNATESQMNAFLDVVNTYYDDYTSYVLEGLLDMAANSESYQLMFGKDDQMYDIHDLEFQVINFLNSERNLLVDSYGFDVDAWIYDIQNMGLLAWFDNLLIQDKDNLADALNYSYYDMAIELLLERDMNPDAYRIMWSSGYSMFDEESVQIDLINFINQHYDALADMGFEPDVIIADINQYGAIEWYEFYSAPELHDALMQFRNGYENLYRIFDSLYNMLDTENNLIDFLTTHETMLNDIGFDATGKIAFIEANGLQTFVMDYLTQDDIEILMDAFVYPFINDFVGAVNSGEVPEFIVSAIFENPHYDMIMGMLQQNSNFDFDSLVNMDNVQTNLLGIDFDALAMESLNLEALLNAIYGGVDSYNAYMSSIETTAPNSYLLLSLFTPTVEQLQPFMVYVDDFNYAMNGLGIFNQYLDQTYWMNDSNMNVDLEVTPEFYLDTMMTLDPIAYQTILTDFLTDLNSYFLGFETVPFPWDENWECVPEAPMDCMDLDVNTIQSILAQQGNIYMHVLFDPSDATWMEYNLDLTELLNQIVRMNYDEISSDPDFVPDEYNDILTGVNNATISLIISEGGTIELPDEPEIDNVNAIVYDLGKFGVSMFARDYLRDIMWYCENNQNALTDLINDVTSGKTIYYINEFDGIIKTTDAFDNELSYFSVSLDLSNPLNPVPVFTMKLYWIDGTEALYGTVSINDFVALFDQDNNLINANAYQTMVGFVNDDNFNLTKLWLMLMLQDDTQHMSYPGGMYK